VERAIYRPILSTENYITKSLSYEEATKENATKKVKSKKSITKVRTAVY
jgi:hypothetical protein